jgi:hypothetical protein
MDEKVGYPSFTLNDVSLNEFYSQVVHLFNFSFLFNFKFHLFFLVL